MGVLSMYPRILGSVKKKRYSAYVNKAYPSVAFPKTFRDLRPW